MNLKETLRMHRLFWRLSNPEPLFHVEDYRPLRRDEAIPLIDGRLVFDDAYLEPRLIDPRLFVERLKINEESPVLMGDFLRTLAPRDLCWTQAFIGCPIRVSSGKVWADPFIEDIEKIDAYMSVNDEWLQKLLEFTSLLIGVSGSRIPVIQPLFRGPIDMAASALGPDRLCVAIYRHPDLLGRFLDFCAEVFIDAFKKQLNMLPRFEGGYGCMYGIWAPGPICRTQADYSVLVSPRDYEKVFLPYDLKVIKASEYSVFHLHSATIHIAEKLLGVPELNAIQVSIDYPARAFSPPVKDLLPIFKRIQEEKPLIINGPVSRGDLQLIQRELPPEGLALDLRLLT
jgi:hypothetical protein